MIFLNRILINFNSICVVENFCIKFFIILIQVSYWLVDPAHQDDFGFENCPHLRTAKYIQSEDLYIFASTTGFQKIPWPNGPKKDFFLHPVEKSDTEYLIYLQTKKEFDNTIWRIELKNKSSVIKPMTKSDTDDDCFITAMTRGSKSADDLFLYVRSDDNERDFFDRIIHLSGETKKEDQFRCTGSPGQLLLDLQNVSEDSSDPTEISSFDFSDGSGIIIDLDQIPNRPSFTDNLFSALGIFGMAGSKKDDKAKYSRKLYLAAVSEDFPFFIFQAKTLGNEVGVGVVK